jgi:DNA polymerase-3 subunit epsilon
MRPPADVAITWRDEAAGITAAMLSRSRPASEVMAELDRMLTTPTTQNASSPYRLIAHNASTERTLIHGQRDHCPTLAAISLLDSVSLARKALPELSRAKAEIR